MAASAISTLNMGSNKIIALLDGTANTDAINLGQLNTAIDGLNAKRTVKVATTANISLSGTQTIDGVSVNANDRVLVKNQTTQSQNGIYVCSGGSWTRASDADTNAEFDSGQFILVQQGTTQGDSFWVLTTNPNITLGSTSLIYQRIGRAGQATAGTYGSASQVPVAVLNDDGTVSSFANTNIAIGATGVTGLSPSQILFGNDSGNIGQSANLGWNGTKFTVNSSNADAHTATPMASFGGAYFVIGDETGGDKTFSNGLGIKFFDSGVAHFSQKWASSEAEMQFGISSGSNALNFDTNALTMRIGNGKVSIGGPAEATSGLTAPLTVHARSSEYGIVADQTSLAKYGILTNGFRSGRSGTVTTGSSNTNNVFIESSLTFNNPSVAGGSHYGMNFSVELTQTVGVTTNNHGGGLSSNVITNNDFYYAHSGRFDMYVRGAATGYSQYYGLYTRMDNDSPNTGSDRSLTGQRIDLNKQSTTTDLKDVASGFSCSVGSFDNQKRWNTVLGLVVSASHGVEVIGFRATAVQVAGVGAGYGSTYMLGGAVVCTNLSSEQTVADGTGLTVDVNGNYATNIKGVSINVAAPLGASALGYGLELAVPSGWSSSSNHYALYSASAVKSYLEGPLGIGTSSPASGLKLHVNGNTILGYGLFSDTYSEMTIGHKDVSPFADKFAFTQNSSAQTVFNGSDLFFRILNVTKMTLKGSSGNFGIGTGDPQNTLHVVGGIRVSSVSGTATSILGRDADGNLVGVNLGSGLTLSSGTLSASGGGGGTPAGSNTQVQFNDSGAFGADSLFTFIKGSQPKLGVGVAIATANIHAKSWNNTGALAILAEDSSGNDIFSVLSSGYVKMGNLESYPRLYQSSVVGGAVNYVGGCLMMEGYMDNTSTLYAALGIGWEFGTVVSGDFDGLTIKGATFAPSSGSATLTALKVSPQINQTGSAAGETYGINIIPTITAAADFRALQISNTVGKGVWQTGSSVVNYFNGNVGFGQTVPTFRVHVAGSVRSYGTGNTGTGIGAAAMSLQNTTGGTGQTWSVVSKNDGNFEVQGSAAVLRLDGTTLMTSPLFGFGLPAEVVLSSFSSSQNNLALGDSGGAVSVALTSSAAIDITGIAGGADGRILVLRNTGSNNITLKNESASSTASNRFTLGTDIVLGAGHSALISYRSATSRWAAMGVWVGMPGSTPSPSVISPSQITTAQNDYAPTDFANSDAVRVSSNGIYAISGFSSSGAVSFKSKKIVNVGTQPLVITSLDTNSTSSNRVSGGRSFVLKPGSNVEMFYDGTSSLWRLSKENTLLDFDTWFNYSASSVTAADMGDVVFIVSGGTATAKAADTTSPASVVCSTGTLSTAYMALGFPKSTLSMLVVGTTRFTAFETRFKTPSTLSDGTNRYDLVLLFGQVGGTLAVSSNTIGITYSDDVNSGKWQGWVRDNGGGISTVDSGVTVAASTIYTLRVEVLLNNQINYYVDGVFIGRTTANWPTNTALYPRMGIYKRTGTSIRTFELYSITSQMIW